MAKIRKRKPARRVVKKKKAVAAAPVLHAITVHDDGKVKVVEIPKAVVAPHWWEKIFR